MPKRKNTAIKKYKKTERKTGKQSTYYRFSLYAGINPMTGRQRNIHRQGFKTYEEADNTYNEISLKISNGTFFRKESPRNATFREVYDIWWKTYEPTVRVTTAQKTKSWFKIRILPEFGDYLISKITPGQVQTAVIKWSAQVVRYKTFLDYFSRVMKYAVVMGYRVDNPVDRIIIPKKGKQSMRHADKNFWQPAQFRKFLKIIDTQSIDILAIFRTLAMTGMRRGELLGLTWRYVSLKQGYIEVKHSAYRDDEDKTLKLGPPKSDAGYRKIPLDPKTIQILKDWRFTQKMLIGRGTNFKIDQLVFPSPADPTKIMQLTRPTNLLEKLIAGTGLPRITIHGFRHSYSTWLYEENSSVTLKDMQTIMGHDDIQVTMNTYTHSTEDGQNQIAEFLKQIDF